MARSGAAILKTFSICSEKVCDSTSFERSSVNIDYTDDGPSDCTGRDCFSQHGPFCVVNPCKWSVTSELEFSPATSVSVARFGKWGEREVKKKKMSLFDSATACWGVPPKCTVMDLCHSVVEAEPDGRESGPSADPDDQVGGVRVPVLPTGWDNSTAALPAGSMEITAQGQRSRVACWVGFLNVHGLNGTEDKFGAQVEKFLNGLDICVLVETHLCQGEPVRRYLGYEAKQKVWTCSADGGLSMFVKDQLSVKEASDFAEKQWHFSAIVEDRKSKKFVRIIAVYIPPANFCDATKKQSVLWVLDTAAANYNPEEVIFYYWNCNARIFQLRLQTESTIRYTQ